MTAFYPTRRHMLQGALASLAVPAYAGPTSCATSPAEQFLESVGINTHLSSEPYVSRWERFRALLGASGIRYLRDEIRATDNLERWHDLKRSFGIRGHLLVSPSTNTIDEMLAYLKAVPSIAAIEGQNEGDSEWFTAQPSAKGDWARTTIDYQRDVYLTLRQHYSEQTLPILSPTVLDWKPEDAKLLRAAASFCDIVALHPYVQRGQEPETNEDYAGLAWYLTHMRDDFKPRARVMATEMGYSNIIRPKGAGVPESVSVAYLPRVLLNNFDKGVLRTFLYAFMDGGTNPADSEHHWGLTYHDGAPKPAYHTIRALLQSLGSKSARQAPGKPVEIALASAPAGTRCHAFRKRDGSTIVAVWREVRCWDAVAMRELTIAPETVTLTFDRRASARHLDLGSVTTPAEPVWSASGKPSDGYRVPVAGHAVLINVA